MKIEDGRATINFTINHTDETPIMNFGFRGATTTEFIHITTPIGDIDISDEGLIRNVYAPHWRWHKYTWNIQKFRENREDEYPNLFEIYSIDFS